MRQSVRNAADLCGSLTPTPSSMCAWLKCPDSRPGLPDVEAAGPGRQATGPAAADARPAQSHLDGAFLAEGPVSVLCPWYLPWAAAGAGGVTKASPGLDRAGRWGRHSRSSAAQDGFLATRNAVRPCRPRGGCRPGEGLLCGDPSHFPPVSATYAVAAGGLGASVHCGRGASAAPNHELPLVPSTPEPMSPGRVWEEAL